MQNGLSEGWNPPWARRLYWPVLAVFFVSVGADLWAISAGIGSSRALKVLHLQPWLLGTLSLGIGLARHLPVESVVLAAIASIFLSVGVGFASFPTTGMKAPSLDSLRIALVWLVLGVGSLGTVRWALFRFKESDYSGYGVLALTAVLFSASLKSAECLLGTNPLFTKMMTADLGHNGSGVSLQRTLIVPIVLLAHSLLMMQLLRNKRPVRLGGDATPSIVLCAVIFWREAADRLSS